MNWALDYNILNPVSTEEALNPNANTKRKTVAVFLRNFEKEVIGLTYSKRFDFLNESGAFFDDSVTAQTYVISNTEYSDLCNAISTFYGDNDETARIILGTIAARREAKWEGACHGMSAAILFDMLGKIDFNRNTGGTSSIFSLPAPNEDTRVRSGIHYYQLAVHAQVEYRNDYSIDSGSVDTGFLNLFQTVEQNGATLVDFFWKESGNTQGHSIVVTDIDKLNDRYYMMEFYDPGEMGLMRKSVVINGDAVTFDGKELSTLGYYLPTTLDTLDYLDIDGAYNAQGVVGMSTPISVSFEQTGNNYLQGRALLVLPATDFELVNAEGKVLTNVDGKLSGSMSVYSSKLLTSGLESSAELQIVVNDSGAFSCVFFDTEDRFVSISASDYCASVSGGGITTLSVDSHSMSIEGVNMDTSLTYRIGRDNEELICLRFNNEDTIDFNYDGNIVAISGTSNNYTGEVIDTFGGRVSINAH